MPKEQKRNKEEIGAIRAEIEKHIRDNVTDIDGSKLLGINYHTYRYYSRPIRRKILRQKRP